jgi:predicted Zn-dependent protease
LANAQRIQRTLESAIGQFQSGNLDGAAELCLGLLKKQPKNHHALHILGAVRLKQNDPATAIKLLKSAAKRDPRNAEILANLGAAYRMSGDPNQAIAALKKRSGWIRQTYRQK